MSQDQDRHQAIVYLIKLKITDKPVRSDCRKVVESVAQKFLGDISVKLIFNQDGKPEMVSPRECNISYSHSSELLAVALASKQEIGIDTEPISRSGYIESLKNEAFSNRELAKLSSQEFLSAWCSKEAILKQMGLGFHKADPNRYTVNIDKESYTLYLDDKRLIEGFIIKKVSSENIIVISSDKKLNNLAIIPSNISDFQKGGL